MELKNLVLLIITISSLTLAPYSVKAHDNISPSPSNAPASAPSDSASSPFSYISSTPSSSPGPSPSEEEDGDVSAVLEKTIKSGIVNAEFGIKQAQTLLGEPSTPIAVGNCLRQCMENLDNVIDDFRKALDDVESQDNYLLSEDLGATSTDIAACDQCFEDIGAGTINPVAKFGQAIKATTTQCLGLLDYTS